MGSNKGENFGDLKAENLQLKDQLSESVTLGKVFVHYLCEQGKHDWFKGADLDTIHHTFLHALSGVRQ